MATDKYNFQYSVLTIIQKGYQYALDLLKYRAQKSALKAEMDFYERIYGRAIKNPESVRIAYTQDDLTPQMMKELAAEHGIPVETDPYGHNFVIYDARYEADLIQIISDAEKRDQRLFEENHFHETQYGYECYATGEYIPYVDEDTGSYIDQEGRFHRGSRAGDLEDDEIIDRLEARSFNPDAVWDRQEDGSLRDEFGYTYIPGRPVWKPEEKRRGSRFDYDRPNVYDDKIYTRCPGGYEAEDGSFMLNYNEYGDYYSPFDHRVHLNSGNRDNEEARIQRVLAQETNPVNSGLRFVRSADGLVNVESGNPVPLRNDEGIPVSFYHAEAESEQEVEEYPEEERVDGEEIEEEAAEGEEIPADDGTGEIQEEEPPEIEEDGGKKKKMRKRRIQEQEEYSKETATYQETESVYQDYSETFQDSSETYQDSSSDYREDTAAGTSYDEHDGIYSVDTAYQETSTAQETASQEYRSDTGQDQSASQQDSYNYGETPYPSGSSGSAYGDSAPQRAESVDSHAQDIPAQPQGTAGIEATSSYGQPESRYEASEPQNDDYSRRHAEENASTAEKVEAYKRAEKYEKAIYGSGTTPSPSSYSSSETQTLRSSEAAWTAPRQTPDYSKYHEALSAAQAVSYEGKPEKFHSETFTPTSSGGSGNAAASGHYVPLQGSGPSFSSIGKGAAAAAAISAAGGMGVSAVAPRAVQRGVEYTAAFVREQREVAGNIHRKNREALHSYQSGDGLQTSGGKVQAEKSGISSTVWSKESHATGKAPSSWSDRSGSGNVLGPVAGKQGTSVGKALTAGDKYAPFNSRDIAGRSKESMKAAHDWKAQKYGFENMTARKKYGFQSMSPGARLQRPSTAGILGAIGGAYRQVLIGADKDSSVHVTRYYRNIAAVANVAGGAVVYKNSLKTAEEYFTTLTKSGKIGDLNKIITANGRKGIPVGKLSTRNIKDINNTLINMAGKAGILERGSMLSLKKNFDRSALTRLGAITEGDKAILEEAIKNALSFRNGSVMFSRGVHVLSYTLRMASMNSDDRTLGYVSQGMDTIRVFRQFGKSASETWNSRLLNKPLKETVTKKAAGEATKRAAGNRAVTESTKVRWNGNIRFRRDATTPLGRRVRVVEEKMAKNAKAVKRYGELRKQQAQARFSRLHRGVEIRAQRLNAARAARLERINSIKRAGNTLTDALGRPLRNVKVRVGNTRIGRKVSAIRRMSAQKAAARKAARTAANRAFQQTVSKAIEAAAKAVSSLMSKLMIVLGIYILVCIVICIISCIILIPVLGQMSAETDDASLANGVAMEDVYDKSNTMTGIIYNELRYMEVQWASEIRSYGTEGRELALNELKFTEYNVSARQYALSQTGADDLLGVWAYDSTKGSDSQKYEGILGPEPFEGAALQDYKLLRDIDGGNTLELRGKPQEGYTSNAKQITAMASVFYQQTVDTLIEETNSAKGLSGFLQTVKSMWKAAWTWFEKNNVPILGEIGKTTGWSWTSVYRNYAYPLMQASHQENFFLSSYIYPTKYTYGDSNSRWDGAKGGNPDENGDQTVKLDQQTGQQAKNGRIGVSTEGGSGKVTGEFEVSNDIYDGQGDEGWEAIEMCSEDDSPYNGYGCTMREAFGYKYNGHFATDRDLNVTHADELSTLYYGSDPDEVSEFGGANNVSDDVSPWDTDSDAERGYNRNSCIIHILQLTDEASECWTLESRDILNGYDFEEETDLLGATFYLNRMNDEYLNRGLFDTEDDLTIQKVEETEDGCDVYVSYPFEEEIVRDPVTGDPIRDPDTGEYEMQTVYSGDGFILHFRHTCQQNHEGYYCGGHLQLRTRGIVYGFSEEQSEEGTVTEEGTIAAFAPKFLDPVNYKDPHFYEDAEDRLPNDSDATEEERNAYPDLHVWNVDEHSLGEGEEDPQIASEDMATFYLAEDIFDVDSIINRKRDSYPGYSGTDEGTLFGDQTSALSKWTGWTLTNMSNAVALTYSDWFETYALADTQTAVGSIYDNTATGLNNLSDAVVQKISDLLAPDLNLNADILDPEAKNLDGDILTDEEREQIDRVRHVLYALNCVGEVSYSQSAHANMYGDLSGKATDCSGFVSNIWRDRIDAPLTVSGLYSNGNVTPEEYHGINTDGIEPGDIILVNPESADGEAHALIYVGTFDVGVLYGDGTPTGDERVFTVDCSSMVFNINDLASPDDTPVESMLQDGDGNALSLSGMYEGSEVESTPKVRSGNVRFADRDYMNDDNNGNMYYLDMYEWDRIGQRQLYSDYSDLGDTGVNFWESSSVITDLTQTRQEMDIQFPVTNDDIKDAIEDVEIDEDTIREPTQDPADPEVDGQSVVLQMNQYIQQGRQSYSGLKRGGIGSNSTIGNSGCTDCSYLMAVSYYTGINFDVGETLSNSRYYEGNLFNSSVLLDEYGLSQQRYSGYDPNSIRDAIDQGCPVIMQIEGYFSFHSTSNTHFFVIMGYNDDGFMIYDPGSSNNSYNVKGTVISYEAFTNGPGDILDYRIIS